MEEIRDVDQLVFCIDTAYPRLCQTFHRLVMGDVDNPIQSLHPNLA